MTTTGTPEAGNGTIAEAAAAFERILDGESPTQKPGTDAPEDPADEAEAPLADTEDDETIEADEAESESDEEATADDEESEEEAEEGQERLVTVKIDGNTMHLPESEVAKGYQRQADYSRHMQQLQQERHAVRIEREQYMQLIPAIEQTLQQQVEQPIDWDELYKNDPLEYVRQKDLFNERQQQLYVAQAERQRLETLQAQEQAQELQAMVEEGREKLQSYNPAWKDSAKWDADRQRLRQYLGKNGFSEDEIGKAYDPRAVTLAHKAMLYDKIMANKPVPVRQNAPRPAPGGVAQTMPARKHTDHSKAKMRLAKTGSVKDAAKVFEGLL